MCPITPGRSGRSSLSLFSMEIIGKLTENELRFEAMQSLVFGVSGLVYFTYWLPNDPSFTWDNAIANRDGTAGPLYDSVKKVNKEVTTLQKYLLQCALGLRRFKPGKYRRISDVVQLLTIQSGLRGRKPI